MHHIQCLNLPPATVKAAASLCAYPAPTTADCLRALLHTALREYARAGPAALPTHRRYQLPLTTHDARALHTLSEAHPNRPLNRVILALWDRARENFEEAFGVAAGPREEV